MDTNKPILDGVDPEVMDRLVSRRDAIRKGAATSAALAWGLRLGSVPVALAALTKDVYGQAPADVLDVLNFAYLLENFENEFYKAVLDVNDSNAAQRAAFAPVRAAIGALGQTGADVVAALNQIQDHEAAHVELLRTTITSLGGTPATYSAASFDFTGGGRFARATSEPAFLLLVAQAVEDLGVRAYKGQAPRLLDNSGDQTANVVLETALRIHSVEARHAAKLRRVRRSLNTGDATLPWAGYILGGGAAAAGVPNVTPAPPAAALETIAAIYAGEDNVVHQVNSGTAVVSINAATMAGYQQVPGGRTQAVAAQLAFEEPLSKAAVTAIVTPFLAA